MSVHLRNVVFWDRQERALREGDLLVDESITFSPGPPAPGVTVIEGHGRLAMEGLVCGHHHLYSGLARGMPPPRKAPRDFLEILQRVWWRLDRCLDLDMVRACALAAGIDALRCGVTAIIDHHASPLAIDGSLATIADALDELGIAHVLAYELSDRYGPPSAAAGLEETHRHLRSGRAGLVGLHASFTVGDELLANAVELAARHDTGIHIHVAEDPFDQTRCRQEHGCAVIERLDRAGALTLDGTLLAHGLHLDEKERGRIAATGAWVVANVESNLNNGVGSFTRDRLRPDRIMLGTDGMHGDMLRSARAAYFLGRTTDDLAMTRAWDELQNARAYLEAHHPAAARRNDVVLFDYVPPTPLDAKSFLGHAFFGLDARHVHSVIAGGEPVVDARRLGALDEAETLHFCREQARRLWDALERA